MSVSKHVTVWCDHQGEHMPEDAYPRCFEFIEMGDCSTYPEARRKAKWVGWKRVKGEDVCPACAQHICR